MIKSAAVDPLDIIVRAYEMLIKCLVRIKKNVYDKDYKKKIDNIKNMLQIIHVLDISVADVDEDFAKDLHAFYNNAMIKVSKLSLMGQDESLEKIEELFVSVKKGLDFWRKCSKSQQTETNSEFNEILC